MALVLKRVVIGGSPRVIGEDSGLDLVDEHGAPALLGLSRQGPVAGAAGNLVCEQLGTPVLPPEGMRA